MGMVRGGGDGEGWGGWGHLQPSSPASNRKGHLDSPPFQQLGLPLHAKVKRRGHKAREWVSTSRPLPASLESPSPGFQAQDSPAAAARLPKGRRAALRFTQRCGAGPAASRSGAGGGERARAPWAGSSRARATRARSNSRSRETPAPPLEPLPLRSREGRPGHPAPYRNCPRC